MLPAHCKQFIFIFEVTLTNSPFVALPEHSLFITTHLEGGKGFLFGAYMISGQWENEQRAFIW